MRDFVTKLLGILARAIVRRYRPMIVGVTGSVGKTSTKEAIFAVLKKKYRVRRSEKSFNTEIGMPLTIIGADHPGQNVFGWIGVIAKGCWQLVTRASYPEILVLEFGVQMPNDMEYLISIAPPLVSVMTAIGDVPVHIEFFADADEIAEEKGKLIVALPTDGYAVLNCDDEAILKMKIRTRAHVLSYGFGPDAALRIVGYELRTGAMTDRGSGNGINFKLLYGKRITPVRLGNTFGKHHAYAAAAAACVGLAFNMNLLEIAEALAGYESPLGRLKLLRGNKNSLILDDTYNASPIATRAALEVLREFPARRKIAVLGDMLELGKYTEAAHREIGDEAAAIADVFIGVGERMKFAMDEATRPGIENRRAMQQSDVFWFASAKEAGNRLEAILKPGDIVLIKGSQDMRLERVVKEVMAEPERAQDLLVRQSREWLARS